MNQGAGHRERSSAAANSKGNLWLKRSIMGVVDLLVYAALQLLVSVIIAMVAVEPTSGLGIVVLYIVAFGLPLGDITKSCGLVAEIKAAYPG